MELLKAKTVLITGANRGIGKAIAETFAEHGANLILHARTEGTLKDVIETLENKYRTPIHAIYFDLASAAAIKKGFQDLFKQVKRLDVLVNNAGVLEAALLGMASQRQIETQFQINALAPVFVCQPAVRLMARNGGGNIINISSVMGLFGQGGYAIYSATKAAIIGLTKSLSKELADQNIRVNAIAPGFIDTDMARSASAEKYEEFLSTIRLQRIGTPEDVANAALFLASDLSSYVTGHTLVVDGGMLI
jgi:3-oxoacyl-[acyl-carrier protein] reductase